MINSIAKVKPGGHFLVINRAGNINIRIYTECKTNICIYIVILVHIFAKLL